MKAEANARTIPRRWPIRLLLAGEENEIVSDVMQRTFDGSRKLLISRSASLLAALERIQTERADIVLLSQHFHDQEVSVFLSNARRAGFGGLVLRVASTNPFDTMNSGVFSTTGLRGSSLHFMRISRESSKSEPSFTDRQRAVLARVSEGWTNGQVARHLACTESAIKATLQQIFKKLGVRKRSQVVRLALEQELVHETETSVRPNRRINRNPNVLPAQTTMEKHACRVGDFILDVPMHRVWVRGEEIHLTPSEFELLEVFAAHQGELVRSSDLCDMFWRNPTGKQDSLRVLVRGLRAKIEPGKIPQYILTERNFGYRFHPSLRGPRIS